MTVPVPSDTGSWLSAGLAERVVIPSKQRHHRQTIAPEGLQGAAGLLDHGAHSLVLFQRRAALSVPQYPQVVIAGHVQHLGEAAGERLEGPLQARQGIGNIACQDQHVIDIVAVRQRCHPAPVVLMIGVDVRKRENSHGSRLKLVRLRRSSQGYRLDEHDVATFVLTVTASLSARRVRFAIQPRRVANCARGARSVRTPLIAAVSSRWPSAIPQNNIRSVGIFR